MSASNSKFQIPNQKFIVLYHDCPEGVPRASHYDFMLEADGVLCTWALPEPPMANRELDAEQLPDHRLDYLDYEGPVSGNRGTVQRWDRGTFTILQWNADRRQIALEGNRLQGLVTLTRDAGQRWRWIWSRS